MKAKIMGRTIEIPDDRVRGGPISRTPVSKHAEAARNSREPVANPAPSPKRTIKLDLPFFFSLTMQIPSGKNAVQITSSGHRYPKKRFKAWRDEAISQIGDAVSFDGPVSLIVDYTPGDAIRRDVPGLLDALCHLIEKIGIVANDAQVKCVQWTTFPVEPKKPRCHVAINPLRRTE